MNKQLKPRGFTLVEVVVVMAIISVLLYFTVPVLRPFFASPGGDTRVTQLMDLIQSLKKRAVEENRDYLLHVDAGTGRVWVSHEAMDEDSLNEARHNEDTSLEDLLIHGVEFPGITEQTTAVPIRFYKEGYSDMALIHIRGERNDITLKIEPFLRMVQMDNSYFSYEDCM